jgi:hypothetical protein
MGRSTIAAAFVAIGLLGLAVPWSAASNQGTKTLVVYAVPDQRGFVNNADDRDRGKGNNPFGNYHVGVQLSSAVETKYGPFPGDVGLFTYKLYSDASHRSGVGSAVLICQYGFDLIGVCDASYQLKGGTLIGSGSFLAKAPGYSLEITGGVGGYLAMRGRVNSVRAGVQVPGGAGLIAPNSLVLRPQRLVFTVHPAQAGGAGGFRSVTLYSTVTSQQFLANIDDLARGYGDNPFGFRNQGGAAATNEPQNGPFPGDEAFLSFHLYSDATHHKPAGVATFSCQYSFDKNASCMAAYKLKGGDVIAGGASEFNASKFSLAVTGGTGVYTNTAGAIEIREGSSGNSQRLHFVLLK